MSEWPLPTIVQHRCSRPRATTWAQPRLTVTVTVIRLHPVACFSFFFIDIRGGHRRTLASE